LTSATPILKRASTKAKRQNMAGAKKKEAIVRWWYLSD
jgi:hypothetical protein